MKVLLTGASGFIGSHTVEELVREGFDVRVFLRYNSTGYVGNLTRLPREILDHLELHWGDIRDYTSTRRATEGVDAVLHLAAQISVPYSFQNPIDFAMNNVVGTTNLLKAALEAGVSKFIHVSTSEIFGGSNEPLSEDSPRRPRSPYAASKVGADAMVRSFHYAYGLNTFIVRPFNTYGPRQSPRALIPWIILQALKGDTVRLGNLKPRRDFTYVKDTARALVLALLRDTPPGGEVNLGVGRSYSVLDVVRTVEEVLGKRLKVVQDPALVRPQAMEVFNLVSDNRRAREILGWEPRYTFREGISLTIDYFRENGGRTFVGWL
ncbi:MAG: NAD-dependent epimerase/dehydratase family protein [Thermotogae bacterium]|nr:NAD-dependent epimerase/dehydratase family protein [Thermotogota bacterium]